jgi:tRNA threonylcarbamoyladenosine biosynthesis protein TsaE
MNGTNTSINFKLEQIDDIATQVLSIAKQNRIFLFYGEMGAGKTTLIKSLCEQLGAEGQASSPTFSIINEYSGKDGRIYHFDFYRLKTQSEALDMGYEEYFYSGDYCFIEWPEKIPDLLPQHYVEVHITEEANHSRAITLNRI